MKEGGCALKIMLSVSDEKYEELEKLLTDMGIEIDDDAELVLSERNTAVTHLSTKDENGRRVRVSTDDIVFIESYGHNVDVHTTYGTYSTSDRLYQLCGMLDQQKFLRVSNSVIIAKSHVKKIKPTLSMKFVLTMSDGTLVDVTRSYYSSFKIFFGI